jgi:hypothetical protein
MATGVEVPGSDAAPVTDLTLQNSERMIALSESFSIEICIVGSFVSPYTEPLLTHSSEYKSPKLFRSCPKAGECKCQNAYQKRSIVATSTKEKNALMENKEPLKGDVT